VLSRSNMVLRGMGTSLTKLDAADAARFESHGGGFGAHA
jgi:hypothetical protein